MDIAIEELGPDVACIMLDGRLDTAGVDAVETRFNAAVVAPGRHALLNLAGVSFVSSMGVRLLITAARSLQQRGRQLVLYGAMPLVQETLENVAIDQIIPLAQDRDGALGALKLG